MKTHKYFTYEEHKNSCPKLKVSNQTMICEDCIIGGLFESSDDWSYRCDINHLKCIQFGHTDGMNGSCHYCMEEDDKLFRACLKEGELNA